jgi:hypothetical protein
LKEAFSVMADPKRNDKIRFVEIRFSSRMEKLAYLRDIEPEIVTLSRQFAESGGLVLYPEEADTRHYAAANEACVETNNWQWFSEELAKRMKTPFTVIPSNLDIEQTYEPTGL